MDHKYLTATDIASYYRLDCELALWKNFHKGHSPEKASSSIDLARTDVQNTEGRYLGEVSRFEGHSVGPIANRDAVTSAIMAKGKRWEDVVYTRLEEKGLLLRLLKDDVFKSKMEEDKRKRFYVTGAGFEGHGLFESEYSNRKADTVRFGTFKPDLIEVERYSENGKTINELRVIEVKASRNLNVRCHLFYLLTG